MKEWFQQLSTQTQALLLASLLLTVYGYVCRLIGLYFFWESSTLGWPLLFMGIISWLLDRIRLKKTAGKKVLPERVGIGVTAFLLLMQGLLFLAFVLSDAYAATKISLAGNKQLEAEIGMVESFGLDPSGQINATTDADGERGKAVLQVIAKGNKKFKDVTVHVVKHDKESGWQVESIK